MASPAPAPAPASAAAGTPAVSALDSSAIWGEAAAGAGGVDAEIAGLTSEELRQRTSMLANQIRAAKSELSRLDEEIKCVVEGVGRVGWG